MGRYYSDRNFANFRRLFQSKAADKKAPKSFKLRLESLEDRRLLSATPVEDALDQQDPVVLASAPLLDDGGGELVEIPVGALADTPSLGEGETPLVTTAGTWTVTNNNNKGEGSLRWAVNQAINAGGGTIEFNLAKANRTITLSSPITVTKQITFAGISYLNEGSPIVISGNNSSQVFVIDTNDANARPQFNGLTIKNGSNTSGNGGGVQIITGAATFTRCTITNCSAQYGGGVYVDTNGNVFFRNCYIQNNTATANGGGIVITNKPANAEKPVRFFNCVITGNTANQSSGSGGGVYANITTNKTFEATFTNCTIAGNKAKSNGGIYGGTLSKVKVWNSIIINNTGGNWGGVVGQNTLSDSATLGYKYNGGPLFASTGSHPYSLALNSEAIDRGSNSLLVTGSDNNSFDTDIIVRDSSGNSSSRIYQVYSNTVDLGAYESHTGKLAIPALNSATSNSASSIVVNIGAVSGASQYIVLYSTNSNFNSYSTKTFTAAGNQTISGLNPSTTYYFRVIARGSTLHDSTSLILNTTASATKSATTWLATPSAIYAAGKGANTIDISIVADSSAPNGTSYVVQYAENNSFSNATTLPAMSDGYHLLNVSFNASTTYYFRVKATKSGYTDSAWRGTATTSTWLATPTFAVKTENDAEIKSANSVTLTIGNVANVANYTIFYKKSTASSWSPINNLQSGDQTVSGLDPATSYDFKVQARAAKDSNNNPFWHDSVESNVVTTKTNLPTPTFSITSYTKDTMTVEIDNVKIDNVVKAENYDVEYSVNSDFSSAQMGTLVVDPDSLKTIGTIKNLDPAETYYVRIKVKASAYDDSSYSNVGTVNTNLDAPRLELKSKSDSSVTLLIGEVGKATSYRLEYSTDSTFNPNIAPVWGSVEPWIEPSENDWTSEGWVITEHIEADKHYFFRFKGVSSEYDSTWSNALDFWTAKTLDTPLLKNIEQISFDSAKVTIDPVDNAEKYSLQYSTDSTFGDYSSKTYSAADVESAEQSGSGLVISGLEPGTKYYFRVMASTTSTEYADSSWSSVQYNVTTNLETPTLVPSSKTSESVTLKISRVKNATKYRVEYASSTSTLLKDFYPDEIANATIDLLPATTYSFRVMALGLNNAQSNWTSDSDVSTVKTNLATPANLGATSKTSASMTLSIGDVSAATGYVVEYSQSSNFSASSTQTFGASDVPTITGLTPATVYYFRVKATSADYDESEWSSDLVESTNFATPSLEILGATSSSVTLTVNGVDNASEYRLYYSADETFASGMWTPCGVGEMTIEGLTNQDNEDYATLTPATKYYFRVKAVTQTVGDVVYGESETSESVAATTNIATPALSVKRDEYDAKVKSDESVTLAVESVNKATNYMVQYSTDSEFVSASSQTFQSAGDLRIAGLAPATTYYFRVKATADAIPESEWSVAVSETTNPSTPTFSVVSWDSSSATISIGDVGEGIRYEVQYSTDATFSDNYTTRIYKSSGDKTIEDLKSATTYYFRVRATLGENENSEKSEWSDSDSATINLAVPSLVVKARGANSAAVVVGYSENAESYVLQYGTDKNFDSYLTKEFGSSGYQILSDLPSAATTYYFRVKAKAAGFQDSDWSSVESETTNLATPSLHVKTAPGGNTPYTTTLTIGDVEKAEIYELQYATDYFDSYGVSIATKTFTKSGDVTIDDLDPMSVYFFRVRAVSAQSVQNEESEQDSDENVDEINYDDSDWSTTVYAVTGLATPSFGFQRVSDSAVALVINPVEGAEKYEILKSQDPEFDEYEVSKIRTLSKTYYGLELNSTYYFRVRALAPAGGSQNVPLPNDELALGNSELILGDDAVSESKYGDSDYQEGAYHTAATILQAPSGLSVDWSATTSDSITLTIDDYYADSSRQFVVQYSDGDGFVNEFTTELPATSDSRITITGLNPGTTYYFRAKTEIGGKSSDWYPSINDTNYYAFRVSETTLRALAAPTVNGATTTQNSATFDISSVLGAEKYEVEYGTDPTFETNVAKKTFRTNGGRKISNLIPGTTYYFRVRATASDSEPSAWTTPNSFKTGLQTPTLSVVASNSNSATLAIQAVNGADKYVLEYGKTKNFSGATSIEYSSAGSKTISGLEVGKTYYFRVRAESTQYGVSAKSKVATAKAVETPRIARVLSEPNALTVELADLASASEFVFEYGTDPSFKTLDSSRTYAKSELSDGQISVDRLASGTRYYLRVRAKLDGEDVIADSAWSTFEAATSLETPTLTVEPVSSNSVLVDLGYVYSATSYALEYGTSASFAPGSTRTATFSSAGERAIYGLSPATTYYFRVKASAPGFGETTSDVVSATSSPLDDASRLTVSSTADDASVPGTLRYALANANDGETIVFASNLQGATITLADGELVVDKAITIDASALWSDDAPGVAISASQTPGEESRVFNLTADATLIGLRIANGLATNAGNDVADTVGANSSVYLSVAAGGGVLVGSGTRASLVDCVVENNRAVASPDRGISFAKGAGICAYGDLTLENCVVVGNKSLTEPGATSAYAFGGGVGSGSQSVVTIRASKIMENQTSAQSNGVAYSFGAGLYASGDASILDGSLVHKNKAKFGPEDESSVAPNPSVPYAYGGGAYAVKSLNVGNSQFTENVALQRGGAIYVNSGASVVVSDGSVFSENNSGSFGGGIFSEGDLFVNGGTSLTKNRSEAGGAIYSVGKLTMTDSVVNENTAECASTATGGGLHLSGAANLQNVAITENQAKAIQPNGFVTAYGGGVYVGDASVGPRYGTSAVTSVSLVNCSVVGNRVESSSDYYGATSQGGGVYATPNGANFQATNCEISGNETVSASLSEVWGAKAQGGGFYGKSAILVNATIVDNATTAEGASAAAQGNGAYFYGTQSQDDRSNVYNSVIARNGTADDNDVFKDLGAWVGAYEVLSPFKGWSYSENLYEYSSTTPLFENYAEKDYRPAGNGQLVDRGVDSYCDEKIDRDLSGKTRVVNKAIDLGAYEFSGDALAEPSFVLERVDGAVRVAIDKPVDGADLYRIEYGDRPGFEGAATKEIVGLTDDLALVPGSTVYVRVRAEGGDYFASNWTSRKYCADDEFASAKSSPVGGVVEIKEVESADSYLIQYGLDPDFTDAETISAAPGANYLAGLIAQERYHVRVQALDASGESVVRWTVASFKTDSGRDAYEPNDSRSAATDLGTVYGAKSLDALNLHSANDEDWFFFAIGSTPGDSCFAKIEFANSLTADLDLELFDPSGNLVGASRGTTGVEKVSLQGLSEGDYALRVYNRAANGTAVDYKLSINAPSEGAADVPVAKIATDPETGLALIGFDSISLEIESTAGYVLEYSTDPNFGSATRVEGASSGALTISDLTPETTYYFHIANANETNPDWFVFEATTEAIPVTQLDAPAISSISTTKSAVTFRLAAVANAANYLVEYSTDSGFATSSSKTYSTAGSKTISGLLSGTTYYFRAKATADGCDDSAWTTFEATTTKETLAAPSLTPGSIGINSIDVAIGEVANATSYVLEYSKSANFASKTTKTYSSAGSRTITGLDADTTYYFRVKATAERFNESAWSTTLSATTLNPSATPLETPNIAALSGTKTAIVIKLDAVEGAQKYVVEYATDASFSDAVAKPYSSAGSKTISGLTTGTWYFVRVKATATGRADSPYTATRKIFTGGGYAMPAASFSAVKTSITLNIKAGKIDATQGAPEKYVIEYSENPDFSNAKTRTVTQGLNDDGTLKPCKPTISSLTFGTKYYIRVKAIGAAGNDSPWNSTSYTAGQLAVPSRFASSVGSDFVNVKCYNVTGMAGFEVMYSTSSDFSNPQYAQGPASGTVAVTGLQSSTKYYFKARALGDNVSRVNSAWSPSFSATTKEAVSSAVLDDDSSFENFFDEQDELDAFWDVLAKSIAR